MSFLSNIATTDLVADMSAFITEPSQQYTSEQQFCRVFLSPIVRKALDAGYKFSAMRVLALRGHLLYMTSHPDQFNLMRAHRFLEHANHMIMEALGSDARADVLTYLILHKVGTASQVQAMTPAQVVRTILSLTIYTGGRTFEEMPDPCDAPVAA